MSIDKFVMGVSVGIGESIAEAEAELFKAKERKNKAKIDPYSVKDNPPFYMEVYKGDKKPDKHEINTSVEDYLELLRFLKKKGPEHIGRLERITKFDLGTTALTPIGYRIEKYKRESKLEKMRKARKARRCVILLDVNDTKYWNEEKASYEIVTEHLNVIGRALVKNCRIKKDTRSDFVAQVTPLVSRKHGDAGDEFIVDLYCPKKYVKNVVERLIKAVYKAQREMNG